MLVVRTGTDCNEPLGPGAKVYVWTLPVIPWPTARVDPAIDSTAPAGVEAVAPPLTVNVEPDRGGGGVPDGAG